MNIQLQTLSKQYGETAALHQVSSTIEDGDFVAVIGPSGCGKSTLLKLLAGFESPTTGSISMDQKIVADADYAIPPEKRNLGMVFQSFALWPHMTVAEQVAYPLKYHRFVPTSLKQQVKRRTDEVLSLVGLKYMASRMPHELSGGQKQRVALARAIAAQPSLLLMDEPLSSLDAELRHAMRRELQVIHKKTKATIIYVTHDQEEALAMADRIIVLKDGQVEQIGAPFDLYYYPQTLFTATFIGKANIITGVWNGNAFTPDGNRSLQWKDPNIASQFYEKGIYPVRPEEFTFLSYEENGIPGIIKNVQFQGREVHYIVEVNDGSHYNVILPMGSIYRTEQHVVLGRHTIDQSQFTEQQEKTV